MTLGDLNPSNHYNFYILRRLSYLRRSVDASAAIHLDSSSISLICCEFVDKTCSYNNYIDNKSTKWSLSLSVHARANSRQVCVLSLLIDLVAT